MLTNKNIDIYFFTGTGNTYLCAKRIADKLKNKGFAVSVKNIEKSNPREINLSNALGIAFPTACWNTFPIVKDFINSIPNSCGTQCFVFTTMGDSSLKCAQNFGNVLKKKGYFLTGAQGFLMPNNFIAVRSKEKNSIKREKAFKKTDAFVDSIIDGTAILFSKTNLFFRLCFKLTDFITNLWRTKLVQKFFKFELLWNSCTRCGLCTKICPTKNISQLDLPSFTDKPDLPSFDGKKCQFCLRCISYCPKQSIKSFFVRKTYRALENIEEVLK
ncbi:MAG: EFR1 family ferrodoxin [Elusimicrobiota bacterium]|jgi:ferredoxin|nr:EFR1 family ferrodoxin [Elusimicrobiota bacterium]